MKNNRLPIFLIVGAIAVICLCVAAIAFLSWSTFAVSRTTAEETTKVVEALPETQQPAQTAIPVEGETTETAATPGPVTSPESTESGQSEDTGLPDDVRESMDLIQQQVIELRGLQPAGTFSREIFSPEELRDRVINDFFSDYSEADAADDVRVLSLLGLLEPDYDLISLYIELFSEQIAGFYDNQTQEMVVVGNEGFGGPEKLTYAHEYNHALQDQNYDFENGMMYNDDACLADSERCAAVQALIEGDATLLEVEWFFEYATPSDQQEVFDYYDSLDLNVLDEAPPYLQLDFVFPYDQGYVFVESLFTSGGWDAIDDAFLSPPVSTEQILHPEKYPGDAPAAVDLPDLLGLLGSEWELYDENGMGEWYTYLILGHGVDASFQLPESQAAEAAAGWGGDRYAVYLNRETGQAVLVFKTVWDTPQDAAEFSAASIEYGNRRFGTSSALAGGTSWEQNGEAFLYVDLDGATLWIAAPDTGIAEDVLALVIE